MTAATTQTDADGMIGPHVAGLFRYPVKGFSAESLERFSIDVGGCIPFDRCYAVENGPGRFDPLQPRHLPKINFLMLMRNERIATLRSSFVGDSETLTIYRNNAQVAKGQLSTAIGRQLIEQFLSSYFAKELRGPPKIVSAPDHSFSDVPMKCLHIVNLASVRELQRAAGRTIDPMRFRANIYVDGLAPWQEFEWIGKALQFSSARAKVAMRTEHCDATNVDPEGGARDMAIPGLLRRQWGHTDFGVYADVIEGGAIAVNDSVAVTLPPSA